MSLRESEVLHVTVETGTLGGDTYWVEHPDWENQERALCYRRIKTAEAKGLPLDSRCSYESGWGTDHLGEGACRHHGGKGGSTKVGFKNGRSAKSTRTGLKEKIDTYIEDGDRQMMLDLSFELGSLRVLFQELIEYFPKQDSENYTIEISRVVKMVQATGSLVDKISKIDSRNNITSAQVMYLRVVMADILSKHSPDPDKRERAVMELMSRVRGGEGDQETRIVAI